MVDLIPGCRIRFVRNVVRQIQTCGPQTLMARMGEIGRFIECHVPDHPLGSHVVSVSTDDNSDFRLRCNPSDFQVIDDE